jgi:hypothetical protein
MLTRERLLRSELPREAHCTAEEATPRVGSKAMVTVRQNAIPSRRRWPDCGCAHRSARARSISGVTGTLLPAASGCPTGMAPAPSWITTWIYSDASPARSHAHSR